MKKSRETDGMMNCRSTNWFGNALEEARENTFRCVLKPRRKTLGFFGMILRKVVVCAAYARTHMEIDMNGKKAEEDCCETFYRYLSFCAGYGFGLEQMVNPKDFSGTEEGCVERVFQSATARVKRPERVSGYDPGVFYRIVLDLMSEALSVHEKIIWSLETVENVYVLTDRIFDFLAYMFGNVEDFVSAFDKWREVYGPSQT